MSEPLNPRAIENPKLVRLLASPVRQEMVDTIAALGGEATIARLAAELGRPADGLYHHIRLLLAAGLVEDVTNGDRGERLYALVGGGGPLRLAYRRGANGNIDEVKAFARALLKIATTDFTAALDRPETRIEGSDRTAWAARDKGWLSDADIAEANRLIERLSALISQPKREDRAHLMSFAFSLAELEPQPTRRGEW